MINFIKNQAANFLTIINLILGLFAIIYATKEQFLLSLIFIIIATLLDKFDGIVARKLKTESDIGKYLDSNSDLISFGVAPAFLIYYSILNQFNILGMIVAFIFIICGGYRLARYNAIKFDGYYIGIPITVAGALLAVSFLAKNYIPSFVYILISLVLSYLMVCRIRVKKV